jgi:ribosomal protein L7/L12
MFDDLSVTQIWLIAAVAVAAFILGRMTAGSASERARSKLIAEQEASRNSARLSSVTGAEVDRLLADGKMIEAIKLIRAELNTGLYEAKQIVDLRKSLRNPER